MPPFTDRSVNPFYPVTGENPVQWYGLEYEKNYKYKFDYLLFEGKTPEEFELNNPTLCKNKSYAGVTVKDMSKKTTNNIRLLKTEDSTVIATVHGIYTTFGLGERFSKKVLDFDLTETLTESSQVEIFTLIGRAPTRLFSYFLFGFLCRKESIREAIKVSLKRQGKD